MVFCLVARFFRLLMKGKFFCDVFEKKLIFAKVARSTVGDSTLSPGIVTSKVGYTYLLNMNMLCKFHMRTCLLLQHIKYL